MVGVKAMHKCGGVSESFYVTCLRKHFIGGVLDNPPSAIIRKCHLL